MFNLALSFLIEKTHVVSNSRIYSVDVQQNTDVQQSFQTKMYGQLHEVNYFVKGGSTIEIKELAILSC